MQKEGKQINDSANLTQSLKGCIMEHPPAIIQKKKSSRHDILVKLHSQPKSQSHTVNRIASLTLMSHKHVLLCCRLKTLIVNLHTQKDLQDMKPTGM